VVTEDTKIRSNFIFPRSIRDYRVIPGEKKDMFRCCGGYYCDQGDSRPTFEMTVLFFVHGGLYKSELAGDPPRVSRGAVGEGGRKEILKHVFATFRARYRENSW